MTAVQRPHLDPSPFRHPFTCFRHCSCTVGGRYLARWAGGHL